MWTVLHTPTQNFVSLSLDNGFNPRWHRLNQLGTYLSRYFLPFPFNTAPELMYWRSWDRESLQLPLQMSLEVLYRTEVIARATPKQSTPATGWTAGNFGFVFWVVRITTKFKMVHRPNSRPRIWQYSSESTALSYPTSWAVIHPQSISEPPQCLTVFLTVGELKEHPGSFLHQSTPIQNGIFWFRLTRSFPVECSCHGEVSKDAQTVRNALTEGSWDSRSEGPLTVCMPHQKARIKFARKYWTTEDGVILSDEFEINHWVSNQGFHFNAYVFCLAHFFLVCTFSGFGIFFCLGCLRGPFNCAAVFMYCYVYQRLLAMSYWSWWTCFVSCIFFSTKIMVVQRNSGYILYILTIDRYLYT